MVDLFLWVADGRPEAVMSLFKSWEPATGFHAELHSLSLSPLEADREDMTLWRPEEPGIRLQDVPNAPEPGSTAVRRLSQMRAIAGQFSAVLTDFRRNNSGERQALRLLSQPMYRYGETKRPVLDGALFAFVLGTDPEVFLLLEAHQTQDAPRWTFGLARMNNDSLAVSHEEREVWRIERAELHDPLRDRYVLRRVPESVGR